MFSGLSSLIATYKISVVVVANCYSILLSLLWSPRLSQVFAMAVPFVCPWACLASDSPKPTTVATPTVATPAVSTPNFAQVLLNKVDVPLSHLPKPCLKGEVHC